MTEDVHQLLKDVAAGKISPEDAASRLQPPAAGEEHDTRPVSRLMIKGTACRLTVVGDPAVAEATVDGPHAIERTGSYLIIQSENPPPEPREEEPPRSAFMNWVSQVVDRIDKPLTALNVRVNPALPIEILLVGGTLELTGIRAAASIGVEAGSAQVADGAGPLMMDVTTGSAKVDWTFTGDSRVRADMGSVSVRVRPDSDVRVTATSSAGSSQIRTPAGSLKAPYDGATSPIVVGSGQGYLLVSARMGSAQVTVD